MTAPFITEEIEIELPDEELRSDAAVGGTPRSDAYPKGAVISLSQERRQALINWIDEWLIALHNAHDPKLDEWAQEEIDYEAEPEPPKTKPYVGASNIVVPVIASGVDPTFARLDMGLFGNELYQIKALRKAWLDITESLQTFVNYYFAERIQFRKVAGPGLLDLIKHGTVVFKTVYDSVKYDVKTYDRDWKPIKRPVTRFEGPRVFHIPLQNLLFPPYYQHLQDCPIVAEIIYTTPEDLQIAQRSNKVTNIDDVIKYTTTDRTVVEDTQAANANHEESRWVHNEIKLYELWFRYDIDGDGIPESMVATYHADTSTLIQLRYNWYHHQEHPYTLIPYTLRSGTLYGIGQCKMMKPFQDGVTDWQQMAMDNNYLANVRGWAARKDSGIEDNLEWYPGKVLHMDDPMKDIRELKLSDTYQSTLGERQNLLGLGEKRSGISDYLTGRESPIVGSRATATSTVALIQEGKARVESVLENVRGGFADILHKCINIWIQYGTGDLEDIVFGLDSTADDIKTFFSNVNEVNVRGAIGIVLGATDPANNRTVQQQSALAIIQIMMQYLEKLLQVGQQALQAQQQMPQYTEMAKEVMGAARKLFKDLLDTYEIRNAEELLPELENFLNGAEQTLTGGQGGPEPSPGGAGGAQGVPAGGFVPPTPAANGGAPPPFPGFPRGLPLPGGGPGLG